jgi:hypothetical protein
MWVPLPSNPCSVMTLFTRKLLVFNLVQGPLGPRTFLLHYLSLAFRGIRVGTPTNLEGGSGRSGPDLLLF